MTNSVLPDAFKLLITAGKPAFLCKIAAARTSPKRHVVPLEFGLRKGIGPSAAKVLADVGLLGNEALVEFYTLHDGVSLFASSVTGKYPLEIYRLQSVAGHTRAMRRWFKVNDMPEVERIEDPFGLRTAIAVGGSPNSSSYLAVATEGPYAGSVFQVDHGGTPDGPVAISFAGFLTRAAEEPIDLLKDAASYPLYSDGRSAILWQPIEFSRDGVFALGS